MNAPITSEPVEIGSYRVVFTWTCERVECAWSPKPSSADWPRLFPHYIQALNAFLGMVVKRRSEVHTYELQSLMLNSYAVLRLKKHTAKASIRSSDRQNTQQNSKT